MYNSNVIEKIGNYRIFGGSLTKWRLLTKFCTRTQPKSLAQTNKPALLKGDEMVSGRAEKGYI